MSYGNSNSGCVCSTSCGVGFENLLQAYCGVPTSCSAKWPSTWTTGSYFDYCDKPFLQQIASGINQATNQAAGQAQQVAGQAQQAIGQAQQAGINQAQQGVNQAQQGINQAQQNINKNLPKNQGVDVNGSLGLFAIILWMIVGP
ncbi:hypothetical protein BCR33DRAFT_713305 [Rhizoclosmatium globosum]|uniref:Uncharacterized protein n=1 Tax=Rhizoclosmatium globosum TaxID=329046 RepID=A0A1Y2CU25_9FUNG|nr:hypothetical protein BCR33DRAFT_713305 [Rhizoclosmatium globosum]|eukprot:ORY50523.1 hypothetical protein BCR33DRAFT_713305 [Rhizoclosmatium globosum]